MARERRARLQMIVSGRVQGVFFRGAAATRRERSELQVMRAIWTTVRGDSRRGRRDALEMLAAWAHLRTAGRAS